MTTLQFLVILAAASAWAWLPLLITLAIHIAHQQRRDRAWHDDPDAPPNVQRRRSTHTTCAPRTPERILPSAEVARDAPNGQEPTR